MVKIKVEYDKYTRAFKLMDREFGSVLEDGTQYELVLPSSAKPQTKKIRPYASVLHNWRRREICRKSGV